MKPTFPSASASYIEAHREELHELAGLRGTRMLSICVNLRVCVQNKTIERTSRETLATHLAFFGQRLASSTH